MKCYFGVDVEAAGPYPGRYPMLSFASCLIKDPSRWFYREIRPTSLNYNLSALKVGCVGLHSLRGKTGKLDPKSFEFDPEAVLEYLMEVGADPGEAMMDYQRWVVEQSGRDAKRVMVTDALCFDPGFMIHYLHEFCGHNMFGHKGVDINSYLQGNLNEPDANIKDIKVAADRGIEHNSKDDVVYMAWQCQAVAPHMMI